MKIFLFFVMLNEIFASSLLRQTSIKQKKLFQQRKLSDSKEKASQQQPNNETQADKSNEKNSQEQIDNNEDQVQVLDKPVSKLDDEFFYIFHNQRRIKYYHNIRIEIFKNIYKFMYNDQEFDEDLFKDFLDMQVKEIFEGKEIKMPNILKLDYKDYKDKIYIVYSNDMRFKVARLKFFVRIGGEYKFETEPAERILTEKNLEKSQQNLTKQIKDNDYKNLDPFNPLGYKIQKMGDILSPLSIGVDPVQKDDIDQIENVSDQSDEVDNIEDEIENPLEDQDDDQVQDESQAEVLSEKSASQQAEKKKPRVKTKQEQLELEIFKKNINVTKQKEFIKVNFDNPVNETQFDVQYYPFIGKNMRRYLENTISSFVEMTNNLVYTADQISNNILQLLLQNYGDENSDIYYKIDTFNPVKEEDQEKIKFFQNYVKQFQDYWPEQFEDGADENNFVLYTLHAQKEHLPDLELIVLKGQIEDFFDRQFEKLYVILFNEQFQIQQAFGINSITETMNEVQTFIDEFSTLFLKNYIQLGKQKFQRPLTNEELKEYNIIRRQEDTEYDVFFDLNFKPNYKEQNYESQVFAHKGQKKVLMSIKRFPCTSENNASIAMLNSYNQYISRLNWYLARIPELRKQYLLKQKQEQQKDSSSESTEIQQKKQKPTDKKQQKKQTEQSTEQSIEQKKDKKTRPKKTIPQKLSKKKTKKEKQQNKIQIDSPQEQPIKKQKKITPKKKIKQKIIKPQQKKQQEREDDPNKQFKEQIKKKQQQKKESQRQQKKTLQNIQNNKANDEPQDKKVQKDEVFASDYMQFHPEPILTPNQLSNLHVKHDLLNSNMPLMFYSLFKKI